MGVEKVPNEMIGQGAGGQGAEHRKNSPELEGLSVRVSVSGRALAVDAHPHPALSVFPYLFMPLVLHLRPPPTPCGLPSTIIVWGSTLPPPDSF